jgi:hypothetical protein
LNTAPPTTSSKLKNGLLMTASPATPVTSEPPVKTSSAT